MSSSRSRQVTVASKKISEIDKFQAWKTLAFVFIQNANTFGALKVHSLIYEKIVSQGYYNREDASWPIATASTIQNLAAPLTPLLALKFSWRVVELIQTLTFVLGYLGAYFSKSLTIDILCLGVLQGIGLSLRNNLNVVINNEYFDKYRTTAMGLALAGSTCGVFVLKPIASYVLDKYGFRATYLVLGSIISMNFVFNFMIRKPEVEKNFIPNQSDLAEEELCSCSSRVVQRETNSELIDRLCTLVKNPAIHCIWLLQTIYFYNNRSYTIFIVDYGIDKGLPLDSSRNLLSFWAYGEIFGRLLLGRVIDFRFFSMRWNVAIVNVLLALFGSALLIKPPFSDESLNYWYLGIFVSLVAAAASLVNMVIVPYAQETVERKNVPWAYAISSVVTSVFLLLRPNLMGFSRDGYGSYSLFILIMSAIPGAFTILFLLLEPLVAHHRRHLTVESTVLN